MYIYIVFNILYIYIYICMYIYIYIFMKPLHVVYIGSKTYKSKFQIRTN